MNIKNFIKNINPLNNKQDMPAVLYVIKKILGFFFIYGLSAVIGEVLIIGLTMAMGYDPLNGDMPTGYFAEFAKYYGCIFFIAVALFYCKLVEKRNVISIGFNKKIYDYFIGGAIGILLLTTIVILCCAIGVLNFNFITPNIDVIYLIALFVGFFIQSLSEETMCRGFLLKSLSAKTSLPIAIFASSTAFALPHLLSILEADTPFLVIGIVNLYLVSIIFSLLYLLRSNIYIVSGLHCLWNFLLYGVMGLSVSGSNSNENAPLNFSVNTQNILNGGIYGLEASIITTIVLGIAVVILATHYYKKEK